MNVRSLINFTELQHTVIGVNVQVQDYAYDISFCVLKNSKGQLAIIESGIGLASIELLNDRISGYRSYARMHINFTGNSVLLKAVDGQIFSHDDAVQHAFPFMRRDELVSQRFVTEKNAWLCVMRIDRLTVLNQLHDLGYNVYSYSLGPFILNLISSFLSSQVICVNQYEIAFSEDGQILAINNEPGKVKMAIQIGDFTVHSELIASYSSACSIFSPTTGLDISLNHLVKENREAFEFNQKLFKVGRLAALITLLMLIINVLLFFWLDGEIVRLESQVSFLKGQSRQTNAAQSKLGALTRSYQSLGWKSNMMPLFYADQLAAIVPSQMQLTVLEIGVFDDGKMKRDKFLSFKSDQILVRGKVPNPVVLDDWIQRIVDLEWVSDVSDQRYQYSTEDKSGIFELVIHIK